MSRISMNRKRQIQNSYKQNSIKQNTNKAINNRRGRYINILSYFHSTLIYFVIILLISFSIAMSLISYHLNGINYFSLMFSIVLIVIGIFFSNRMTFGMHMDLIFVELITKILLIIIASAYSISALAIIISDVEQGEDLLAKIYRFVNLSTDKDFFVQYFGIVFLTVMQIANLLLKYFNRDGYINKISD